MLDGCSFDTEEDARSSGERIGRSGSWWPTLSQSRSGSSRVKGELQTQRSSSTIQKEKRNTIRHLTLSESSDNADTDIAFINKLVNDVDVGGMKYKDVTLQKSYSQGSRKNVNLQRSRSQGSCKQSSQESQSIKKRGKAVTKNPSWDSSPKQGRFITDSMIKRRLAKKSGQNVSSIVRILRSSCRFMVKGHANQPIKKQT